MGPKIFPASIIEVSSRNDVTKKEKDFHLEKANESIKAVAESTPAKKERLVKARKRK